MRQLRARRCRYVVLIAVWAALLSAPAEAYVRSRVRGGSTMHWESSCQVLSIASDGPKSYSASEFQSAVTNAAAAWSAPQVSCTNHTITVVRAKNNDEVGFDGRNVLVFRAPAWCRVISNDPAVAPDCTSTPLLALTTVFSDPSTGAILDADIEINGADKRWMDLTGTGAADANDLQNAVTHEIGHFLGFAHACRGSGDLDPLPDNAGIVRPFCEAANATQRDSTMFPSARVGDIDLRTLSEDDVRGLCEVYPSGAPVVTCLPSDLSLAGGGGCSVAHRPLSSLSFPLVAVGLGILARAHARRLKRKRVDPGIPRSRWRCDREPRVANRFRHRCG